PPVGGRRPARREGAFGGPCAVVRSGAVKAPICLARGRCVKRLASLVLDLSGEAGHAGRDELLEPALRADALCAGYGRRRVLDRASAVFPKGKVPAIGGPNARGKPTLLRALARQRPAESGAAFLGDRPVTEGSRRSFAREVGLLAQSQAVPPGALVEELVAAGRFPHQTWYRRWSPDDERAVRRAMEAT